MTTKDLPVEPGEIGRHQYVVTDSVERNQVAAYLSSSASVPDGDSSARKMIEALKDRDDLRRQHALAVGVEPQQRSPAREEQLRRIGGGGG